MPGKKISIYLFLLIQLFATALSAQINIAVMEFSNESEAFYLDQWQRSIPDLLKSELSKNEDLILLERRNLKSVLQEMALSQSGLTDSTSLKIGRLLNAEYIISGSIHYLNGNYIIESSLIRVKNGQTHSEKVQCPNRNYLQEMVKILANNISYQLTGKGKPVENKRVGHNPTKYFLMSSAALAIGAGISWGAHQDKYDEYHANEDLEKFSDLYQQSNNLKKLAVGLSIGAGSALLVTFYSWLKHRSPQEISTSGNRSLKIQPQFSLEKNQGVSFGAKIHF